MSRFLALAALGAFFLPQACLHAQVTATAPSAEPSQYSQRWDIYGGALYSHFNPSPGAEVRAINLLGWNASATLWLHKRWGIESSARGAYGTLVVPANSYGIPSNPPMSEYLFLFGPSVRMYRSPKVTLGMHFLIGAAYGKFDSGFPKPIQPQQVSIYNDKLAFGMAWGGFADYNIKPHWAVRFVSDWQPTHYGFSQQNEFAGSAGIVYKFGKLNR
jgi:opacity protein-like surface antigen